VDHARQDTGNGAREPRSSAAGTASLADLLQRARSGTGHIQNVASFAVARIAAVALYLAPVPLFIAKQGEAAYGSLNLLLVCFSYLNVFDLGIGYAVNQRFARALARGNTRREEIIQRAWPVFLGFSLATTAAIFLCARPIALFLTGNVAHVPALRLLSVAVGFLMTSALLTAVLQAYNRIDWINYSRLVIDVMRAAGLCAGAFAVNGVAIAVAFTVAGSIIKAFIDLGLATRVLGGRAALRPRFRIRDLVINLRLGFPMVASVLLGMLMTSADRVVVARQLGQQALAHYSVAADLCSRPYFLVWAVSGSVYTLYVRRRAVGRSAEDLVRVSLLSVCVVALLIYLPLALFAQQIIGLWIDPAFAQASAGTTRIWAAAGVAYLLMSIYYNHLQAFRRPLALALNSSIGAAILLAGLFTLPRAFGIEGAATSVLLGFSTQAFLLWLLSRRLSAQTIG